MPELPEVESVARYLNPQLRGRKLIDFKINWRRTLASKDLAQFRADTINAKIERVWRRGKYLLFDLKLNQTQRHLLVHLRMSGALQVFPASVPVHKHDRAIFYLSDGKELRFNDTRKFGRVYLAEHAEQVVGKLGPEPLDPDFQFEDFFCLLKVKQGAIKPLLLNQSFIAGLGNIYVDEALWRAKIHPLRRASRIKIPQAQALFKAIRHTLRLAIDKHGTDIGDNVVEFGGYNPQVYQRDGLCCKRCRSAIRRITVGQRGTHFCPACQPR